MEYEQLIPWVKPVEVSEDGSWKVSDKGFRVIPGDYVTTEDGTGIVHIAPTFGADDANAVSYTHLSFKYGIDIMEQMGIPVKKIHAGHANMFLSSIFRDTLPYASQTSA